MGKGSKKDKNSKSKTDNESNNDNENNTAGGSDMEDEKKSDTKIDWGEADDVQLLDLYETALSKAWNDGIITSDEKFILDGIRDKLNITDEEHEEIEGRVLSQLKEQINCPKCDHEIEVGYSTDEKIRLQCPGCGAKGRIANPFSEKKEKGYEIVEGPEVQETDFPVAQRIEEEKDVVMAFMCPHCQSSFETKPTEDPQKIPCPSCEKEVKIIKPITFECPDCNRQFPSVLQKDSKVTNCPYCQHGLMLKK